MGFLKVLGGAIAGFVVGGPVGAAIGALGGAGASVAQGVKDDNEKKNKSGIPLTMRNKKLRKCKKKGSNA